MEIMDNTILIEISDKLVSALNSEKSALSTFAPYIIAIASVLTSIVIGITSYKTSVKSITENIKALDKSRYMETISKERTRWIEKVRECFSGFNHKQYELSTKIAGTDLHEVSKEDKEEIEKLDRELRLELSRIGLYLNGKEIPTKIFFDKSDELIKYITLRFKDNHPVDFKLMKNFLVPLMKAEDLILKAEWRRVKTEVENGKEISTDEMQKIFDEVAIELGEKFNNLYLSYKNSNDTASD